MYKFHLQCQNCGEQFNVELKYMIKKDYIYCPNCSNVLPEEAFKHAKSAAIALEEYKKAEMGNCNEFEHFVLTIE